MTIFHLSGKLAGHVAALSVLRVTRKMSRRAQVPPNPGPPWM